MKPIHFTTVLLLLVVYVVGARWPVLAQKIGLA